MSDQLVRHEKLRAHPSLLRSSEEFMSTAIVEDEDEIEEKPEALLRNNEVKSEEDAVYETHKRVATLHKLLYNRQLAAVINYDAILANTLIKESYSDWPNWLDRIVTALIYTKYPDLAVKLVRALTEYGISTSGAVDKVTRDLFLALLNFSKNSDNFNEELTKAGLVKVLNSCLRDSELRTPVIEGSVDEDFLIISLSILHNVARNSNNKVDFFAVNVTDTIRSFLDFPNEQIQCLALLTISQVLREDDSISSQNGFLDRLIDCCYNSLVNANHRHKELTAQEIAEGICLMAVNEVFKSKLIENAKTFTILDKLLQSNDKKGLEQYRGLELAWQLSFESSGKVAIQNLFTKQIQTISNGDIASDLNSSIPNVKFMASALLSYIQQWDRFSNRVETYLRLGQTLKPGKAQHVMLSYSRNQKRLVERVASLLRFKGNVSNIWVDFKDVRSNPLDCLEKGIENASVVVIFFSESYKNSSSCQAEAEYALKLGKPIISVKAQSNYVADGWLRQSLAPFISVEVSGIPVDKNALSRLVVEIFNAQKLQRQSCCTIC